MNNLPDTIELIKRTEEVLSTLSNDSTPPQFYKSDYIDKTIFLPNKHQPINDLNETFKDIEYSLSVISVSDIKKLIEFSKLDNGSEDSIIHYKEIADGSKS